MSSKFLESDGVDSKIFAGRVFTLLGELSRRLGNIEDFLEYTFRSESVQYKEDSFREVRKAHEDDIDNDEDYGDGSDEE